MGDVAHETGHARRELKMGGRRKESGKKETAKGEAKNRRL
jgi:hypothetical protein